MRLRVPASLLFCLSLCGAAHGAVLEVGAGKAYATPCAAIAAAQPNDEVDVSPGTYTDSCPINVKGLVLKGVGGRPKIDLSGTDHPAEYKGIYVVHADDVRIENLELTGAHISVANGENGAGIRVQANGLVVHGCYIHDNQDGILGAPLTDNTGTLTIEYSELAHNGLGNGCGDGNGCTHNLYANHFAKVVLQYNWTHDIATDGHLFKSRAAETDVLYNRITGENGGDSFEIDLPNGGLAVVVGNVIEKGPKANNAIVINYGEEGLTNADKRLYVAYNTIVNDLGKGTFLNVAAGGTLTAHDNLLVGAGTPSNTGALPADNLALALADARFVDPAHYDYHLTAMSPALGKAVDPGSVDGRALMPTFEYVQPTQSVARATAHDVGAFELGTPTGATDGGAGAGDGGSNGGGADGGAGADGGGAMTPGSHHGGCTFAGDAAPGFGGALALVALAVAALFRRRA